MRQREQGIVDDDERLLSLQLRGGAFKNNQWEGQESKSAGEAKSVSICSTLSIFSNHHHLLFHFHFQSSFNGNKDGANSGGREVGG